ncbi:MAG: hypothetical protein ABI140_19890 [Jatrophihabitantaceae bacterium]
MSRQDQIRPSDETGSRPHRFTGTPTDRPSPLQNRVLPTGEIIAHPARGTLMGNRGCIHGIDRQLGVTRWRSKMWISCVLKWGNTRRDVMPPGRWTALFFLDEATALSAGHRPCGYCRRADHLAFAGAWGSAQRMSERPRAAFMDIELHAERVDRRRRKLTRSVPFATLPDGAMIMHEGAPALVSGGRALRWSLAGYGQPRDLDGDSTVVLLTPPKVVGALAHGYRPMVHPTAGATSMRSTG